VKYKSLEQYWSSQEYRHKEGTILTMNLESVAISSIWRYILPRYFFFYYSWIFLRKKNSHPYSLDWLKWRAYSYWVLLVIMSTYKNNANTISFDLQKVSLCDLLIFIPIINKNCQRSPLLTWNLTKARYNLKKQCGFIDFYAT